jgi:hypothetical protein
MRVQTAEAASLPIPLVRHDHLAGGHNLMPQIPRRAWLSIVHAAAVSLAIAAGPGTAVAQRTWTIDGAQFQATVAAAAPGDILLVRGVVSLFPALTIDKALHIHGVAGAQFQSFGLTIQGVPAGQSFVLQGFEITGGVRIRACAGAVLLAGLRSPVGLPGSVRLELEGCFDVSLSSCRLRNSLVVASGSSLTISDSEILAPSLQRGSVSLPTPGITALDCFLRVARSRVIGGSSEFATADPHPGILMAASSLRVSGANSAIAAGVRTGSAVSAIDGEGTITLDPAVTLTPSGGAPALGVAIRALSLGFPTTSVDPSPIGGVATIRLHGPAGSPGALVFGLPSLPETLPGILGELRVANPALVSFGYLDANGVLALSFGVPNDAILRGIVFRWQGIALEGAHPIWAEASTECHF